MERGFFLRGGGPLAPARRAQGRFCDPETVMAEKPATASPDRPNGTSAVALCPFGPPPKKNIATGVARRESAEEADGKWWPAPLRGVPASRVVRRIGGKRARIDNFGWSQTMRLAHAQSCRGARSKSGVLAAQRRFPARCVGSNEQTLHWQTAARKQKMGNVGAL